MTVEEFRKKAIALIGAKAETWGASYMLGVLRNYGPAGETLRQAYIYSGLLGSPALSCVLPEPTRPTEHADEL